MTNTLQNLITRYNGLNIKYRNGGNSNPDQYLKAIDQLLDDLKAYGKITTSEFINLTNNNTHDYANSYSYRNAEIKQHFVKVEYRGGGWFVFSPTGHKYYNRFDEIKCHGYNKLVASLIEWDVWAIVKGEYVGSDPTTFFTDRQWYEYSNKKYQKLFK